MNSVCRSAPSALVLLVFALAACGDSSGPPKAGPPTTLAVVSGNTQDGQSGDPLGAPLVVKVTDANGLAVAKAVVSFNVTAGGGSVSQRADTTGTDGLASTTWTMGPDLGDARVEARVQGLIAPAVFTAVVKAGAPTAVARVSDLIGASAAGFDVSDSVAIKVTDKFQHPVSGVSVSFAVTAGGGSVSQATRVTGDDGIARTAWTLGTAGTQTLRASAGAFNVDISGTAISCDERTMNVGDVLTITPTGNTCLLTNGSGTQKYVIAIANTSSAPSSFAQFRLRGAGGGAVSATSTTSTPAAFRNFGLSAAQAAQVDEEARTAAIHDELMRANAQLIDRLGTRRADTRVTANLIQAVPLPNVGDMVSVKIPKDFSNLCSAASAANIRARVVYVGTKSVILEDSASTLAGQFDDRYRAVGQEFDNVMFPILTANFGNPLAYDDQTDQNGHIFMVFSPVVNTVQNGGIAGFVTSGDFFPPSQCAASNFGEYFFARVPTVAGTGFGTGTVEDWARRTRTVIIHEVKHVTSFAEKFASPNVIASGFFSRDQWLEESSAMMAEELWARTVFGYAQGGNVNYRNSVYCEVRPDVTRWTECQSTKPLSMFDHFIFLYDYVSNPEGKSAVGAVDTNDFTFYGSGWLFLRWAIDNYAQSEASFLSAITRETEAPGTESMEARTAKPLPELLADFALAVALDDYPGFTPKDAKHSIASWNTRDIFAGMSADFSNQNFFTDPTPLAVRPAGFGKFAVDVSSVHGGGFSVFELSGSSTNKQLIEFRGASGSGFPSEMRVKVVRVQ